MPESQPLTLVDNSGLPTGWACSLATGVCSLAATPFFGSRRIKGLPTLSRVFLRLITNKKLVAFLVATVARIHGDKRRKMIHIKPMSAVHQLLTERGRQGALELGAYDRPVIEAAAAYLGDEDTAIGYLYSGWCQAALPHKKLPDTEGWQIQSDYTSLIVEPGMRLGPAGKPVPVGIPYGSRAKLILIYLQTEAIRTQSREIELGGSLRAWLTRLGITVSGPSAAAVRDQAERIARCRLTFQVSKSGATGLVNQNIVDEAMFLDAQDGGSHETLFLNTARLSEGFYSQLRRHPVPLEESAIKQLSNNSMALDAYAWMAYRLHSLRRPTLVPWPLLMAQFGGGFRHLKHFKPRFLVSVRLATAVYPAARIDEVVGGLLLHNSPPPVARKLIAVR